MNTTLNFSCTSTGPVFTSRLTFVRERYRESWSFKVEQVGEYVVLTEVRLDGNLATCCYTCLATGLSGCIREKLTEAGVPDSQPVILVWPGETQCWDGSRTWLANQHGITLRAHLWEELAASLPPSLEELAQAANDLAQSKAEKEWAAVVADR